MSGDPTLDDIAEKGNKTMDEIAGALSRLEQLCMEVCERPPTLLIHEAIDLIVFIARGGPGGRVVTEMLSPAKLIERPSS